jgi:hypothetical protein
MAAAKKNLGTINGAAGVQKKSMGKMGAKPGAAPVNAMMKRGGKMGKKKC